MNNKGFTLIETLIYIAIIGGILASFVTYSITISNSRNKTYAVQEVQANLRIALQLISQQIRSANGVNVSSSIFAIDPGVLSLSMSSSTINPTVINLNQDDGVLQIVQGNDEPVYIISSKVKATNLVFTNLTASGTRENIGIDLTVNYDNSDSDINYSYSQTMQTSVSLRH